MYKGDLCTVNCVLLVVYKGDRYILFIFYYLVYFNLFIVVMHMFVMHMCKYIVFNL